MSTDNPASTRAASNFFLDTTANLKVFGEAQRGEMICRTLADLFRAIAYGNLVVFNQEITRLGLFGSDAHQLAQSFGETLHRLAEARRGDNPTLAALYGQAADALTLPEPSPVTPWSRSDGA